MAEKTVHSLDEAFAALDAGVLFLDILQDPSQPDVDTRILDAGLVLLAEKLPAAAKLKSLNLYHQGITAKGIASLAAVLPQTHLQKLRLGGNDIGDEGCKELASVLPKTKMTNLDLFSNGITDDGFKLILFSSPPSLMGLTLDQNKLSGDGVALYKEWNFNPKAWRLKHQAELVSC